MIPTGAIKITPDTPIHVGDGLYCPMADKPGIILGFNSKTKLYRFRFPHWEDTVPDREMVIRELIRGSAWVVPKTRTYKQIFMDSLMGK